MEPVLMWFRAHPIVGSLCFLMLADVVMGLLLAFANKTVNSSISRIGMLRKVATMMLVACAFIIEPWSQGVPTGQLTALAFAVTETISVVENAAGLGMPIPKPLIDVLSKLRGEKAAPITLKLTSDAQNRVEQEIVEAAAGKSQKDN